MTCPSALLLHSFDEAKYRGSFTTRHEENERQHKDLFKSTRLSFSSLFSHLTFTRTFEKEPRSFPSRFYPDLLVNIILEIPD